MITLQTLPPPPPNSDLNGIAWQGWFQKLRTALNNTIAIAISGDSHPSAALLSAGDFVQAGSAIDEVYSIPGPQGKPGTDGRIGPPGMDGEVYLDQDYFPFAISSNHDTLSNLQGGAANEYYHLTNAQLNNFKSDIWAFAAANG